MFEFELHVFKILNWNCQVEVWLREQNVPYQVCSLERSAQAVTLRNALEGSLLAIPLPHGSEQEMSSESICAVGLAGLPFTTWRVMLSLRKTWLSSNGHVLLLLGSPAVLMDMCGESCLLKCVNFILQVGHRHPTIAWCNENSLVLNEYYCCNEESPFCSSWLSPTPALWVWWCCC